MDPISAAVIVAVSTWSADEVDRSGRHAITTSYQALRNLLGIVNGSESAVLQAVDLVEKYPGRKGLQISLAEEVQSVGADQDRQLLDAANRLLDLVKAQVGEERIRQILAGGVRSIAAETISGSTISTGDTIVNIQLGEEYDLKALFEQLLTARGTDDKATVQLLQSLREIQTIHAMLQEWKELHNHLNNILIRLGQLTKALEKPEAGSDPRSMINLRVLWNGVEGFVNPLIDWATTIRCIHVIPYIEDELKQMSGPKWAIEIQNARRDVNNQVAEWAARSQSSSRDPAMMEYAFLSFYEVVFVFNNLIETNMFTADQALRETAGLLAKQSEMVLGSLSDVKI